MRKIPLPTHNKIIAIAIHKPKYDPCFCNPIIAILRLYIYIALVRVMKDKKTVIPAQAGIQKTSVLHLNNNRYIYAKKAPPMRTLSF